MKIIAYRGIWFYSAWRDTCNTHFRRIPSKNIKSELCLRLVLFTKLLQSIQSSKFAGFGQTPPPSKTHTNPHAHTHHQWKPSFSRFAAFELEELQVSAKQGSFWCGFWIPMWTNKTTQSSSLCLLFIHLFLLNSSHRNKLLFPSKKEVKLNLEIHNLMTKNAKILSDSSILLVQKSPVQTNWF